MGHLLIAEDRMLRKKRHPAMDLAFCRTGTQRRTTSERL